MCQLIYNNKINEILKKKTNQWEYVQYVCVYEPNLRGGGGYMYVWDGHLCTLL